MDAEGAMGYILEVDLDYTEHLHDAHNEYPLSPERLLVNRAMLSQGQLLLAQEYGIKYGDATKLTPNLFRKGKYFIHQKVFQLYCQLGLISGKIYRVLSFSQKRWLKPYIELNTDRRAKAKFTFEKNFYKLMNNSVYGKNVKICVNESMSKL